MLQPCGNRKSSIILKFWDMKGWCDDWIIVHQRFTPLPFPLERSTPIISHWVTTSGFGHMTCFGQWNVSNGLCLHNLAYHADSPRRGHAPGSCWLRENVEIRKGDLKPICSLELGIDLEASHVTSSNFALVICKMNTYLLEFSRG